MEIYFKEMLSEDLDDMKETDLKFEIAQAVTYKKEADEGILDSEAGYLKIITLDISAGGFMFKSAVWLQPGMLLKCLMMVENEAIPAVAQVLRVRNSGIAGEYFVHAQFYRISEPVRGRLIRHLIRQQREQQSKVSRRE
jgi:c-di-GMP-binding flagellar brake protein YcgR